MAKRNADRMFERFSPVSDEQLSVCTSVLRNTVDADAGDSTESGNFRPETLARRCGATMLKLSRINHVVTEI